MPNQPDFVSEPEPDEDVWRYITFHQFVSILERESLYFNRADRFSDPFEGSLPLPNTQNRKERFNFGEDSEDIDKEKVLQEVPKIFKSFTKFTFINCWHINPHESAAMWNLYSNQGLAIRSTYEKLATSISSEDDVIIGEVEYIDYESEEIDEQIMLSPYLHKRLSYQNEKELRAIIQDVPQIVDQDADNKRVPNGNEVSEEMLVARKFIDVDLDDLIDAVYVAPSRDDDFLNLVKSIRDTYDLDCEIERSELDKDPVY